MLDGNRKKVYYSLVQIGTERKAHILFFPIGIEKRQNMKYEVVIIWETGEKEVWAYATEEEAELSCKEYKMVFREQISWIGTRKARN